MTWTAAQIIYRLHELLDIETSGSKPVTPKDWLALKAEAKKWLKQEPETD